MSEWGRLQDALHDEFDRQGVTGVDVDKVIEHIVNLRDFFPGLLGASAGADPEPRTPTGKWLVSRSGVPAWQVADVEAEAHRQADELGHETDGRLFHEAICTRCGLELAYNVRDQVECVRR